VGSVADRFAALGAARESLVLLKNDGVLPLRRFGDYNILVTGPSCDSLTYQVGGMMKRGRAWGCTVESRVMSDVGWAPGRLGP
jgi:beta-glucosidase-like glycosyl hydrolase